MAMYPPQQPGMLGMGAPRNTVMPGLAGQRGVSSYSLATTANPLMPSAPPQPSDNPSPSDDEVLGVLRRYLGSQDLMSVYVPPFLCLVTRNLQS